MDSYSVMIARFPGNNQEHPESSGYAMHLFAMLGQDKRISRLVPWRKSDTPITMVRNLCVMDALRNDIDYLLMLDSDMSPDCEPGAPPFWETAWEFLMERRAAEGGKSPSQEDNVFAFLKGDLAPATIAAPYCGPPPVEMCYVFRWAAKSGDDATQSWRLEMFDRDHAADQKGIQEVAALPTGLILYDMRVFKKLPAPWFEYEWTDKYRTRKASTEDVVQTRNASLIGLPQFCAWDCWAGHIKMKKVVKPYRLQVQDIQGDFADAILRNRNAQK